MNNKANNNQSRRDFCAAGTDAFRRGILAGISLGGTLALGRIELRILRRGQKNQGDEHGRPT